MKYDWTVLVPELEHPATLEDQGKRIADVLESDGELSRTFRSMLARMITNHRNSSPFRLHLNWKDRGQPPQRNVKLGCVMIEATEGVKRGHLKAVKSDVAAKFGVSLRTAEGAMKLEREWRELCALLDSRSAQRKAD
jgi:hypothetical protein